MLIKEISIGKMYLQIIILIDNACVILHALNEVINTQFHIFKCSLFGFNGSHELRKMYELTSSHKITCTFSNNENVSYGECFQNSYRLS